MKFSDMDEFLRDNPRWWENMKKLQWDKDKVKSLILWLLSEYDWTSSEQTKKEFIQEFEERMRKV